MRQCRSSNGHLKLAPKLSGAPLTRMLKCPSVCVYCLVQKTVLCSLWLEQQKQIQDLIDIFLTFAFIWEILQPKLYGLVYGTLFHPSMQSIPGYRKTFSSNLQHHLVSMRSDLTINKLASLCLVGSTPECEVGKFTFNLNGRRTGVRKHPQIGQTYIMMDQNSANERYL